MIASFASTQPKSKSLNAEALVQARMILLIDAKVEVKRLVL